ncbi:hypothetical protein M9H77_07821 [Catharanthus roseus]|uniref:Uncharacterized protein n=1 Tax=Catharanthus roseus TaxID=4058 RepID=A0ACC0BWC1_CATRO|nr:hypothetical protein M9H77_07821 [Catharanthus roseus]
MITFFETFVIVLNGIATSETHFLNVNIQLENPCDDHKILIELKFLNAFLFENVLGFQFYPLHFKERSCAFPCQVLLEIDYSIPPSVNIISNVARLLWLFEGKDSRMNPFKGGVDGMTWEGQETIEWMQGPIKELRRREWKRNTRVILGVGG